MLYKKISLFLFVVSMGFSNAVLTTDPVNSLSYSFGFYRDNESTINNQNKNEKINADLYKAEFFHVMKGVHEISFKYLYNKSIQNGYYLPIEGPYGYLSYKYHLKEREKFPISISFGIDYGEDVDNYFNSNSFSLNIYKEISNMTYPIIPYFTLRNNQTNFEQNNYKYKESYLDSKIGLYVKLPVKSANNSDERDIIWLNFILSSIDKNLFLGINFGIYHPI